MKLQAMFCPYCGGNVKIDLEKQNKSFFCMHCGEQVFIDNEVTKTEHTEKIINYAQIEKEKAKVELERIKAEARANEAEAKLREQEMILKRMKAQSKSKFISSLPIIIGIIAYLVLFIVIFNYCG